MQKSVSGDARELPNAVQADVKWVFALPTGRVYEAVQSAGSTKMRDGWKTMILSVYKQMVPC
ncbi:MAG: hypothetical protein IJ242_13400 [Clostridia bacterium]|nr:hypothetical protein [Clostridia bacterium]